MELAEQLNGSAPELVVHYARQVIVDALVVGPAVVVRAQALLAGALVRLGRPVDAVDPALAALRGADQTGLSEIAVSVRLDLATCAQALGEPLLGCAILRPVLEAAGPRVAATASAVGQLVGLTAHVARRDDLEDALAEADRLFAADERLSPDARRVQRALLAGRTAAYHRRYGETEDAIESARAGLTLLAKLRDGRLEGGHIRAGLVLELVFAMLDDGQLGDAEHEAAPLLAQSVRGAAAPAVGRVLLAMATRVLLPAGRVEAGRALLDQVARVAERHGLDWLLADGLAATADLDERAARPQDALRALRLAHAAEHRHRRSTESAARQLRAEFGVADHLDLVNSLLRNATRKTASSTPALSAGHAPVPATQPPSVRETTQPVDTDEATGLLSREGLSRRLEAVGRANRPVALTLVRLVPVDANHHTTDTNGQRPFDADPPVAPPDALTALAGRVRDIAPDDAELARSDGAELAVLLPHTTRDQAEELAATIRESDWLTATNGAALSISTGVAQSDPNTNADTLLTAARQTLTHAQHPGPATHAVAGVPAPQAGEAPPPAGHAGSAPGAEHLAASERAEADTAGLSLGADETVAAASERAGADTTGLSLGADETVAAASERAGADTTGLSLGASQTPAQLPATQPSATTGTDTSSSDQGHTEPSGSAHPEPAETDRESGPTDSEPVAGEVESLPTGRSDLPRSAADAEGPDARADRVDPPELRANHREDVAGDDAPAAEDRGSSRSPADATAMPADDVPGPTAQHSARIALDGSTMVADAPGTPSLAIRNLLAPLLDHPTLMHRPSAEPAETWHAQRGEDTGTATLDDDQQRSGPIGDPPINGGSAGHREPVRPDEAISGSETARSSAEPMADLTPNAESGAGRGERPGVEPEGPGAAETLGAGGGSLRAADPALSGAESEGRMEARQHGSMRAIFDDLTGEDAPQREKKRRGDVILPEEPDQVPPVGPGLDPPPDVPPAPEIPPGEVPPATALEQPDHPWPGDRGSARNAPRPRSDEVRQAPRQRDGQWTAGSPWPGVDPESGQANGAELNVGGPQRSAEPSPESAGDGPKSASRPQHGPGAAPPSEANTVRLRPADDALGPLQGPEPRPDDGPARGVRRRERGDTPSIADLLTEALVAYQEVEPEEADAVQPAVPEPTEAPTRGRHRMPDWAAMDFDGH
ncbi:MAG: diguanylate cyclase domain-containing protein [Labedaea sp.]